MKNTLIILAVTVAAVLCLFEYDSYKSQMRRESRAAEAQEDYAECLAASIRAGVTSAACEKPE